MLTQVIHCGTPSSPLCQMLTACNRQLLAEGLRGRSTFLIVSQLNQCFNYGSKSKDKKKKRLLTGRLLCCSKQIGLTVVGANCLPCNPWHQKTNYDDLCFYLTSFNWSRDGHGSPSGKISVCLFSDWNFSSNKVAVENVPWVTRFVRVRVYQRHI